MTRLQKASTDAVDTIVAIMRGPTVNPFVRLQAAHAMLEMAVKSRAIDELEARIAALEHAAISA
jgi:hypothetical protein